MILPTPDPMIPSLSRICHRHQENDDTFTLELAQAADDADMVIEAIPEKLEWKQKLFADLEELTPERAIFATNTSSLSIAKISANLSDPGRVIGTHFFNPVHIMALLELIVGVGRAHLGPDAGRRLGHDRIREGGHVHAPLEQASRELLGERGVSEQYRDNRVRASQ